MTEDERNEQLRVRSAMMAEIRRLRDVCKNLKAERDDWRLQRKAGMIGPQLRKYERAIEKRSELSGTCVRDQQQGQRNRNAGGEYHRPPQ